MFVTRTARLGAALALASITVSLATASTARANKRSVWRAAASLFEGKRWMGGGVGRKAALPARYWRLSLFDDFKGRPSASAADQHCYDQLPAQCHIWGGGDSYACNLAHLPESDTTMIPPLRENMAAAVQTLDKTRNWAAESYANVKARYGQLIAERTRHLNKCTWTLYHMLNWMSTDYQGRWAARFDPLAVRVIPEGAGYLELSAVAAPMSIACAKGGRVVKAGAQGRTPDLCAIAELPANVQLARGVRYWVDANPQWPGVYYAAVNGACPHGGAAFGPNCQVHAFEGSLLDKDTQYALVGRQVQYYSLARERCEDNVVYLPHAIRFKNVACQVLNGGMMSQRFNNAPGTPGRGFMQKYGRFEVKLKIPRGEGAFPAAWLMPNKGGWPYSGGEIDIVEARDNANEIYQTYHHGKCYRRDPQNGNDFIEAVTSWSPEGQEIPIEPHVCQKGANACVASYRLASGASGRNDVHGRACPERFRLGDYTSVNVAVGHTEKERKLAPYHLRDYVYSVEWSPERLDYFLDGEQTHTVAVGTKPTNNYATGAAGADIPANMASLAPHNFPREPFYFILNHSTWVRPERRAGFQPQRLLIDYVKAYTACNTPATLCPCGGSFSGGTCAIGAGPLACAAGEPMPTVQALRGGGRGYASPCVTLDVPKPSTGAAIATAVQAVKQRVQKFLAGIRTGLEKAWRDVVAFFGNLKHWLERFDPCVRDHVHPLARQLANRGVAAANAELAAFWNDVRPTLAAFSGEDKKQVLAAAWTELTTGLAAQIQATRQGGASQVRGWFNKKSNKDSAERGFRQSFDAIVAAFERALSDSFTQNAR